ncbi:hypothetical protein BofuT4_uP069450.1 [Botrytis cinerea T4]|uniref:Uncharacterized protein n=1 Tax=Botryotinia fuckeliana (strain T4) TaxID=999810 RepID=G2XQK0_BOTF4|nr:hypothetical protein BofuT4_uP069450.1 [Botrytis cinerea T4]
MILSEDLKIHDHYLYPTSDALAFIQLKQNELFDSTILWKHTQPHHPTRESCRSTCLIYVQAEAFGNSITALVRRRE